MSNWSKTSMAIRWDKFTVKAQEAIATARPSLASATRQPELIAECTCWQPCWRTAKGIITPVHETAWRQPGADGYHRIPTEAIERLPKVSGGRSALYANPFPERQPRRFWSRLSRKPTISRTSTFRPTSAAGDAQAEERCRASVLAHAGATHDAILKALTGVRGIAARDGPES